MGARPTRLRHKATPTRYSVMIGAEQLSPRIVAPWGRLAPRDVLARAQQYAEPGELVTVADDRRGVRIEVTRVQP